MLGILLAPCIALAVCGDGVVDTGESCDDLNITSGDGCDASCQPEAGWTCAAASFSLDFNEVLYDDGTPPQWTVSTDGLTVYQSQNASPAIYGSTLPAPGVTIGFTLSVQTSADDDFIGWSIGYEQGENVDPNADWLLFDWKQAYQSFPPGLRVYRVQGAVGDDFWYHTGNITELAQANTIGSTGWADHVYYNIEVSYSTSGFQVYVDGTLEFDETGVFPTGNFGFYNYSQENIEYSLVSPLNQSLCSQDDTDSDGLVDLDEFDLGTDETLVDTDGDGIDDLTEVGDPNNPLDSDGDGTIDAVDCDSTDPAVTGSVYEDGDCDGLLNTAEDIDGDGDPTNDDSDGDGTPNYLDTDSDNDGSLDPDDCAPADGANAPGGTEVCDGQDNDCNSIADFDTAGEVDIDGDGSFSCADCDDADAANAPGGTELCDGQDNDCNSIADFDTAGEVDGDADGSLSCVDCDDADVNNVPGGTEVCDGQDNDCAAGADFDTAGEVDADADGSLSCADCDDADVANAPGGTELCDGQDNDCDGEANVEGGEQDGDGDGSLSCADCDDENPDNAPGNEELCDGADNDCDDEANAEGGELDGDGDGSLACADCDDADAANVPGGAEVCDGQDNDCDGEANAEGGEDADDAGNRPCAEDAAGGCSCQSSLSSGTVSSLSPVLLLMLVGASRRRRVQH